MPSRSDILAKDLPTILYMIYRMVSAQQMNLLRETAEYFRNDANFHSEVGMPYNKARCNT